MNFENPADVERVGRFWRAPNLARKGGLKAVDMFRAAGDGRVEEGSVGAGTGATFAKQPDPAACWKGGLGTAAVEEGDRVVVLFDAAGYKTLSLDVVEGHHLLRRA